MIGIVIPTHERPRLLHRALASLRDQTRPDWQAIVVKNGDRLPAEYAEVRAAWRGEGRIRFLHHPVAGLPVALNQGLRVVEGSYLSILEDDDEWEPTFLEEMARCLDSRPEVDVVYCDQAEYEGGRIVNRVGPPAGPFQRWRLLQGNWIAFPMAMFRRECLQTLGDLDELCDGATDWDTWLRLSRRHRFLHLERVLVKHHWHGENLSLDRTRMDPASALVRRRIRRAYYG